MILLEWLFTWLLIYAPAEYHLVASYPIFQTSSCYYGYIGYSRWPPDIIYIDMDCLNKQPWGPWDKVVVGAGILVHEATHLQTHSAEECGPMKAQVSVMEKFPWPPQRLLYWYRGWAKQLCNPPPPNDD